ncbi:MAG TPA: hypothetical protein PKK06_05605 [Phycisphaerae bacterium]|nr:hypothetical protein [Phycisphaerae bacterium]HNU44766.1 hypothetical protein [Phycisphaerae bacterium]
MQPNQPATIEQVQAAFRPAADSRTEINRAIGQARWHAQHDNHHAAIHEVPSGAERKTWYECRTHGRVGALLHNERRMCPQCGIPRLRQERLRPDIAAADRRARRRWYWQRRRNGWRERPTPTREYTDRAGVRAPARDTASVSTCRILPK